MNDLIERDAALGCFHDWVDRHGDVHSADEMPEYAEIEALPSAQPIDLQELEDRFGEYVRFVVNDMLTGEGKRWTR